jgi:hypothetical protein
MSRWTSPDAYTFADEEEMSLDERILDAEARIELINDMMSQPPVSRVDKAIKKGALPVLLEYWAGVLCDLRREGRGAA